MICVGAEFWHFSQHDDTCTLFGYDIFFFFQAEDGIRDLVRSRGLGDVYKRQSPPSGFARQTAKAAIRAAPGRPAPPAHGLRRPTACLLYTSDAADERSSVDLGGRRIIKKKTKKQ